MIRLGRVDYINTFPLAWSLARHLGDGLAEEVVGVPTTLNALLRAGDVDVANVSSVEYARNHAEYVLLPSLCVGSDGAVESVQLVTDVPLPAVQSIAVTAQSALVRRARAHAVPARPRSAPRARRPTPG